jgi:hypothetical protein
MKSSEIKVLKSKYKIMECTDNITDNPNYVYAPYIPICTKTMISDENGTRTIWQIGYWMRFKLFVYGLFYKKRKIKNI